MNKQETKRRLNCLEADCKNLNTEIGILKAELAEAEKPKLQHGDFGTNKDGDLRLVLAKTTGTLTLAGCCKIGSCFETVEEIRKEGIIFGNIFDLMKGWGKPFERFGLKKQNDDEFYFHIESTGRKEVAFKLNNQGNWFYANEAELEEIWRELGHALMELKRKEKK